MFAPIDKPSRWWVFKFRLQCLLRRLGLLPPMFNRTLTPRFSRDIDTLRSVDIREIMMANSAKAAWEEQAPKDIGFIMDAVEDYGYEEQVDRHSVNCYFCGKLVDERECTPADDLNNNDGGDCCTACHKLRETL